MGYPLGTNVEPADIPTGGPHGWPALIPYGTHVGVLAGEWVLFMCKDVGQICLANDPGRANGQSQLKEISSIQ